MNSGLKGLFWLTVSGKGLVNCFGMARYPDVTPHPTNQAVRTDDERRPDDAHELASIELFLSPDPVQVAYRSILVGPEPDLSSLLSNLLADRSAQPKKLKKGSATLLRFDGGPVASREGSLLWCRSAKELAPRD